jgi:hypothetical protein
MTLWVDTWGIRTLDRRGRQGYIALHNPTRLQGTGRTPCRLNGDARQVPVDTLPHLERADDGFIRAYFPDEDGR